MLWFSRMTVKHVHAAAKYRQMVHKTELIELSSPFTPSQNVPLVPTIKLNKKTVISNPD